MADGRIYSVEVLPDFNRDGRGIAFLISKDDKHVDAINVFDKLQGNNSYAVKTRFEAWLDHKKNDRWFHGWPNHPSYKDCFTFKWKDKREGQRLYGFLCKPSSRNPGYQLCVLVLHATKTERETETSELDRVVERSRSDGVKKAVVSRTFRKPKKEVN